MENNPAADRQDSDRGRLVYTGTVIWLASSLTIGWLPLLWFNGWNPPTLWLTFLAVTLGIVEAGITAAWWFVVGWCFKVKAWTRRNAVVLAALIGGAGILIECGTQLNGPFGATGGDAPGIGDVLAAPFVPVMIAVPILLMMGAGFYIHAILESREGA